MKQVVIENPVLNSPFEVPERHFKFDDEGITNEIIEARRNSAYFIPIAKPKMQGKQLRFDAGWTQERVRQNEDIDEVICYAKNDHVGFTIPYTFNGQEENYRPDFIARTNDGHGPKDPLNLILEVTGARDEKKATKVSTAQDLWVEAVNNHGGLGRWGFIEVTDPWDAANILRSRLAAERLP